MRPIIRACAWIVATSLVCPPLASATTFTVNSVNDEVDSAPGDGVCQTVTAVCTLRAAIQEANALAGPDTIMVPAGTYTLTIPQPFAGTAVDPENGDLDVTEALVIDGDGAGSTIIQAGTSLATSVGRVFDVTLPSPPGPFEIREVTIRHGNAAPSGTVDCLSGGGGLTNRRNAGNQSSAVILWDSVVTGNAAFGSGGGLCAESPGALFLIRTTVSGNEASNQGGGIKMDGGQFFSADSTISGNIDHESGGGIAVFNGQAELINTTISGNTAHRGGGLVNNFSTVVLRNATVVGNTATTNSGGVISAAGTTSIRHTLIGGNSAPKFPDCVDLTSLGHNVIA